MNLQTQRLLITEINLGDVADIHDLHSKPEVVEFNTLGIPKELDETKEVLRSVLEDQKRSKRTKFGWAVRLRGSGEFVGEIGLNLWPEKWQMGEVFYNLVPEQWGNGYAYESVKRVLQFGFEDLGLHRIEAGVATENVRSIRLLEKLGMQCEGRRRAILPIRGAWKDNFHYSLLDSDLFPTE